jgi:hypothetical protein
MEIAGKLIAILPLQTGQGKVNAWKKQDFVIETGDQYPKKVCFSVWGDKLDNLTLAVGDDLNVSFDIESREYNGRWYTDVRAWKVDKKNAVSSDMPNDSELPPPNMDPFLSENDNVDLPF